MPVVELLNGGSQGELLVLVVARLGGQVVAVGPVVVEIVPHAVVDGGHRLHVAPPPVASEVLGLRLEQLQDVQLEEGVPHLEGPLQDRSGAEHDHDHRATVLPLRELLEYAHQVDAGEEVAPTVPLVRGRAGFGPSPNFSSHHPHQGRVHAPLPPRWVEDAVGKVHRGVVAPRRDVLSHGLLVEELEDEGDAVGKDELLADKLKLVYVVQLEVLQEEKQDGRHGLDDDLLVPADIQGHLGRLDDVGRGFRGKDVHQDVQGVVAAGTGRWGGGQEDLEEGDHVLGEVGEEGAVQGLRRWVDPPWWEVGGGGGGGAFGFQGRLLRDVYVGEGHVDVVVEDPDALPDGVG